MDGVPSADGCGTNVPEPQIRRYSLFTSAASTSIHRNPIKLRQNLALLALETYAGTDGGSEMGGMNDARRTTYDLY